MKASAHLRAWSTLPQRIRAGCDCHFKNRPPLHIPLPQRIRAGCDDNKCCATCGHYLCHSAFVRVATGRFDLMPLDIIFATAHSCGLRRFQPPLKNLRPLFATAHSCGLRRSPINTTLFPLSLPQRIRAGCDLCAEDRLLQRDSLPQRIRAGCDRRRKQFAVECESLPQRIRAGCDCDSDCWTNHQGSLPQRIRAGCDW